MKKKVLILVLSLTALAKADDTMVQRKWIFPELTPIIEVNPERNPEDPFASEDPDWKPLSVYKGDQIRSWLENNGVDFPPNSRVIHTKTKNGKTTLKVTNSPRNLDLIDFIFSQQYPVQTSLQLMHRFLLETKDKPIGELVMIIQKYPGQTLGPLHNLVGEIQTLETQLATNPKPKLKKIISERKKRLMDSLPKSIQATRIYFQTLVKAMDSTQ